MAGLKIFTKESMKRLGWSLLICWLCLSCNHDKSQDENPVGQSSSTSATGNLRGVVSYKDKDKPLPDVGAKVYVVSTKRPNPTLTPGDKFNKLFFEATVDVDGSFTFNNLPADTYMIIFKSKNAPKKLTYYKTRYSEAL